MEINSHEDIVIDILSRLPVKSVKRFKRVSRSWNKLISHPYFKRKHLNHHQAKNQTHKMLLGWICRERNTYSFYTSSVSPRLKVKDVEKLDSPSICVPGFSKIYCCIDGLFLIGISNWRKDRIFLLWNPSTRESRLLPRQNTHSTRSIYGLGYDSTSDDYKVFKVVDQKDCIPNEILSLKSDSWREIDSEGYRSMSSNMGIDCLAFVNGAFHWLSLRNFGFSVISFDISNEIYGEVPLPEQIFVPYPPHMYDKHVTVLGGMLSINCLYGSKSPFIDIWVMKEYGVKESWTKLLRMDMGATDMLSIIPVIPKYIFENGEVLLKCKRVDSYIMTSSGSVGLSDLIRPLVSDDDDIGNDIIIGMGGDVYTESLIFPQVNREVVSMSY